jgi:hypothetical protein
LQAELLGPDIADVLLSVEELAATALSVHRGGTAAAVSAILAGGAP